MTSTFKQIIASIKELSADERALIAHCLISSLESKHDEGVDKAWAELAEQRLMELDAGEVQGLSWNEIKNHVMERDG